MTKKHKSNVNFKHFIRDQIELYPFGADEAALVELIANSLDAKSSRIDINFDKEIKIFELLDNGSGMTRRGFSDYHDFAMSFKKRGEGIGFAGLGAKLALWLSDKVETETRSARFSGFSEWKFDKNELVWRELPKRTLSESGTKTTFHLKASKFSILQQQGIERIIRRHYYPLLDPYLSQIYIMAGIYPKPIEFFINGKKLTFDNPYSADKTENIETFLLGRGKRRPKTVGTGFFVLGKSSFSEEQCGVGICTYGKVVNREFFGTYPKDMQRISGYVEVPYLSKVLTTTKSDFIKVGTEGLKYNGFRRDMQKRFGSWLEKLGKIEKKPEATTDTAELEKVISRILGRLPELSTIFAAKIQQEINIPSPEGETLAEAAPAPQKSKGNKQGEGGVEGLPLFPESEEAPALKVSEPGAEFATTRHRTVRFGPKVGWLESPTDLRLSWIDGETVVINSGHKAFKKAQNEGSKRYHYLLSIAMALVRESAPATPQDSLDLLNKFFVSWGET